MAGSSADPVQRRVCQQPVPALQQFFRWLAEEEQIPDPMARLRAPKVTEKLVPVFTSGRTIGPGENLQRPSLVARSNPSQAHYELPLAQYCSVN